MPSFYGLLTLACKIRTIAHYTHYPTPYGDIHFFFLARLTSPAMPIRTLRTAFLIPLADDKAFPVALADIANPLLRDPVPLGAKPNAPPYTLFAPFFGII